MAKLPSGFVFTVAIKDATHIEVEQKELVKCRDCKHYFDDDLGNVVIGRCELLHSDMRSNFWCADGEKEGDT